MGLGDSWGKKKDEPKKGFAEDWMPAPKPFMPTMHSDDVFRRSQQQIREDKGGDHSPRWGYWNPNESKEEKAYREYWEKFYSPEKHTSALTGKQYTVYPNQDALRSILAQAGSPPKPEIYRAAQSGGKGLDQIFAPGYNSPGADQRREGINRAYEASGLADWNRTSEMIGATGAVGFGGQGLRGLAGKQNYNSSNEALKSLLRQKVESGGPRTVFPADYSSPGTATGPGLTRKYAPVELFDENYRVEGYPVMVSDPGQILNNYKGARMNYSPQDLLRLGRNFGWTPEQLNDARDIIDYRNELITRQAEDAGVGPRFGSSSIWPENITDWGPHMVPRVRPKWPGAPVQTPVEPGEVGTVRE